MNVLLEKSLINSHCFGLDSLVVKDAPGMVRIFIARSEHKLYRNYPGGPYRFSVAMHKHHCDVTLMPIFGEIYNITMGTASDQITRLRPYQYKSPILGAEAAGFHLLDNLHIPIPLRMEQFRTPLFLSADTPHTVYVSGGKTAAWWVWEGQEDPAYSPVVWSNDDLTTFSFDGLNQPMTAERLSQDLAMIGVQS